MPAMKNLLNHMTSGCGTPVALQNNSTNFPSAVEISFEISSMIWGGTERETNAHCMLFKLILKVLDWPELACAVKVSTDVAGIVCLSGQSLINYLE